jgi:hypothetical protein
LTIPKIYLETTIFNFPFADNAPQYRTDTLRLFEEIRAGKPEALREVHAIRLLIRDETRGMRAAEHTAYFHEASARLFAPDTSSSGAMASNAGVYPGLHRVP